MSCHFFSDEDYYTFEEIREPPRVGDDLKVLNEKVRYEVLRKKLMLMVEAEAEKICLVNGEVDMTGVPEVSDEDARFFMREFWKPNPDLNKMCSRMENLEKPEHLFMEDRKKLPPPLDLTPYLNKFFPVNLYSVTRPNDFYLIPKDLVGKMKARTAEMTDWYEKFICLGLAKPLQLNDINPGEILAGFSEAPQAEHYRKWVRILVVRKKKDPPFNIGVYGALIDHGGVTYFPIHNLLPLKKCWANEPPLASKGFLRLKANYNESKKRQEPVLIPDRFRAAMKYFEERGQEIFVEILQVHRGSVAEHDGFPCWEVDMVAGNPIKPYECPFFPLHLNY